MSSVSSPNSYVDGSLGGKDNTVVLLEELQKVDEQIVHRFQTEGEQTAIVGDLHLLLLSLSLWLWHFHGLRFGLSFDRILLFKYGTILGFQFIELLFDFVPLLVDIALLSTGYYAMTMALVLRPIGNLTLFTTVCSLETSVTARILTPR